MSEPKKYGVETKVRFPLYAAGTNTFLDGATLAAGDAEISKDDGDFAAATNTIVDEGNGFYSLTLTATEMEAANIMVSIRDAAGAEWENQGVLVHTYGHASAAMAFDFDQATPAVNVTQLSGDATAADNAESFFDDSGFDASNSTIGTCTTNTDMRGTDSALLASGYTVPPTTAEIEAALINEGDGQQLIDAILQVINANLDLPALELTAIGQAVRSELTTELARIDAAISSRASASAVSALNDVAASDVVTAMQAVATDFQADVSALATAAAVAAVDTVVDGIATSVGALNDISVANILDGVIEGTVTLKHSLQISNAVLAGKVTGADGLTISFRDLADSKNRIVTTADANNNRTAVVRSYD